MFTSLKQKLTHAADSLRTAPVKETLHQVGESIERLEVKQKLAAAQSRWEASPMKAKVDELGVEVNRAFTTHPKSIGETYLQHLWFTTRMSLRLIATGLALLLHGLFPFLFTGTASREFDAIYNIMKNRIAPSDLLKSHEQAQNSEH
jgi:hypothetical protein